MSRFLLIGSLAVMLASFGTASANQNDWAQARLACAVVGIDPSSAAFGQCVVDLYYSLDNAQNEAER
jgi:hypothetical protein